MSKYCPSCYDPLIGVVLSERELDNAIMAEELSCTTVERDERSDDAEIPASLCDVAIFLQFGWRLLYERHTQSMHKLGEE